MEKALLVMDYINEIVHPQGKFKGKGYANFAEVHGVLGHVARAVGLARTQGIGIVYVRVGFSSDYENQPKDSPLFGKAHEFGALKLDTWATQFHESLDVRLDDKVITKHRVSPFFGTDLDAYLRANNVREVYLAGVSTDLVVESAARDAHDRDYRVLVLEDCCAAGDLVTHQNALATLRKIARVGSYESMF